MNDDDAITGAEEAEIEELIGSFNPAAKEGVEELKVVAKLFLKTMYKHCPHSRRRSIAITHVEEATMMAVKSLFQR